MFDSLLVANRGEIACRVIRTCRRLGIRTIAVYSDADASARHVRAADTAVRIGPAPARDSYLDAQAIVAAAVASGAQAIHPGYGFLSEKLELVDACAAAGIVFVGPHRDAIARMGSKIESKRIARAAGVACVPGYDGSGTDHADDGQDVTRLTDEARRIGFPLLIKASAGGGGKGMKRVDDADAFVAQLGAARREAEAAFGDDRVLLERYVESPRHLEVQLLGDRHGGLVHLFERECSIQRNYQKVIEEAPANHLSDAVRERLFDAALALGRAIGYDSAGTVEFVLDADRGDEPYFLEVNTRLQVEHPVTEATATMDGASIDLVEWQLRVAAGERLPCPQQRIARRGWAIEARINAEIPDEDFAAAFGRVEVYEEPRVAAHGGLRIDSGIDAGSVVTPHYDSMLTKVIGSGATRAQARDRLVDGVRGLRIEGVRTNQALLADVLCDARFDAVLTTRFLLEAWPAGWRPAGGLAAERIGAAAAAWFFAQRSTTRTDRPMDALVGFRLTAAAGRGATTTVTVSGDGVDAGLDAGPEADAAVDVAIDVAIDLATTGPGPARVTCRFGDATLAFASTGDGVTAAGHRYRTTCDGSVVGLWRDGDWRRFAVTAAVAIRRADAAGLVAADVVVAAMPGLVAQRLVQPGHRVTAGKPLVVMEAMKLMYTLVAPRDGVVRRMPVEIGETVARGTVLVEFEAPSSSSSPSPLPSPPSPP